MALFDLNRAQDVAVSTLKLAEIAPKNWHRYPPRVANATPANVPVIAFNGGLTGDEVSVAAANSTDNYAPVNQAHKAALLGTSLAVDITTPRGWIDPAEPYNAAPAPTLASISPTTSAKGPGAPFVLTCTGTGFLPTSVILFGNNPNGERTTYVSPTSLTTIIQRDLFPNPDPAVQVKVQTADKLSAVQTFAFT
jgi:hypothetical protein